MAGDRPRRGDARRSAHNPAAIEKSATAEVTATTPRNGLPGLTATAVHSEVVASHQVVAGN